ncbi:hypothetical protein T484DRAFT_1766418, partial [Baffinella frigidus]
MLERLPTPIILAPSSTFDHFAAPENQMLSASASAVGGGRLAHTTSDLSGGRAGKDGGDPYVQVLRQDVSRINLLLTA